MRPKLSIEEQIKNLKSKGVKFNIVNEVEATEILRHSTYFFKLKAYAKNYKKANGLYQNLEFAYLYEISKIDMYFRRMMLNISMNIEHALKVKILRDFESLKNDGYDICRNFIDSDLGKSTKSYLQKPRKDVSISTKLIKNNPLPEMPFWVLIEVIQLGDLKKLYEYFYNRFKQFHTESELSLIINSIFSLKCLRNSAAHNNCILTNIFEENTEIQKQCLNMISSKRYLIQKGGDTIEKMLKNRTISDFLMTMILVKLIVKSDGLKNGIKYENSNFFKKICSTKRRLKYFVKNRAIINRAKMVYLSYKTILS